LKLAIKKARTLVNRNIWVQLVILTLAIGLLSIEIVYFITRPYIDKNKEILTVIAVSIVVVCFATVMLINNRRRCYRCRGILKRRPICIRCHLVVCPGCSVSLGKQKNLYCLTCFGFMGKMRHEQMLRHGSNELDSS